MQGLNKNDERRIRGRMGKTLFLRRLHQEDTRELKVGGLIRLCPLKILRPFFIFAFKVTGLWRRGYREFINPVVRENTFVIPGLPAELDGFTILHLSDLHLDLDTRLTPVLADRIHGLKYDLAVITGDFNNFTIHMDGRAIDEMGKLYPAFTAPVYGVLGNHDSLRDIPDLERLGIHMLINEGVRIPFRGFSLRLAGIDDPNIFQTHNLDHALRDIPGAQLTVLLSHSPCIHRTAAEKKVDIVLAGHTHGGQICLPGGRRLPLRNNRGADYVQKGRWCEGSTQGWTSSGSGSCGVPIRINCPPEILLHRLVAP